MSYENKTVLLLTDYDGFSGQEDLEKVRQAVQRSISHLYGRVEILEGDASDFDEDTFENREVVAVIVPYHKDRKALVGEFMSEYSTTEVLTMYEDVYELLQLIVDESDTGNEHYKNIVVWSFDVDMVSSEMLFEVDLDSLDTEYFQRTINGGTDDEEEEDVTLYTADLVSSERISLVVAGWTAPTGMVRKGTNDMEERLTEQDMRELREYGSYSGPAMMEDAERILRAPGTTGTYTSSYPSYGPSGQGNVKPMLAACKLFPKTAALMQ